MEENKTKKKNKYLLIGVLILFLSILGASVAYYLGRVSGNITGNAAGTEMTLNIEKLSTSANEDLIPLDNTVEMLGKAILGYGNNGSFDSTKSCIDKNGRTVCQIYKITVSNRGSVPLDITGGVQLVGANTPNIDCAVMNTNSTITSNNTCIGANTLANNETLSARSSKDYYIIVYINNLHQDQYDSGEFNGTISFVSTQGKRVKARMDDTYNAAKFLSDKFEGNSTITAADGVQYSYDTTNFLMYDRLGGTTSNLEEGNLRYYGANPNNYIDIGDKIPAIPETQEQRQIVHGNWEDYGLSFEDSNECYEITDCSTNYAMIGQLVGQTFTSAEQCNAALPTILSSVGASSIDDICGETTETEIIIHEAIPSQPILYRIIGVFDGNLKIIRNEQIGEYSYDTSSSSVNNGYGINEWSQADLMKLLNPGYTNNQDLDENDNSIIVNNSLWWNSESGNCYSSDSNNSRVIKQCDFINTGLSNEAKDLIVDNLWYLGGINYNDRESFAKSWYADERGNNVVIPGTTCTGSWCNDNITRTTKWIGRVGLPYPSDYGYATDLSICTEDLYNYYNSPNCTDADWLYDMVNYLTMTPTLSDKASSIYRISYGRPEVTSTLAHMGIHPTMYLKKDVVIESGTGTMSDPYIAG